MDAHRISKEAGLTEGDWRQRGKDLFLTISLTESPLAPAYDRSAMTTGIVHIGVGGFHRAHEAAYLDRLMRRRAGSGPGGGAAAAAGGSCLEWGICGVGLLPGDARMRDVLATQDHLYTLVLKHPGGLRDPAVIGSIHNYLFAPDDPEVVLALLSAPTTRIVSLTVTEGGYNVDDATAAFRTEAPGAVHDAEHPGEPTTAFGYIVEALRRRREAGIAPLTVMSCDNLPGNGKAARTAVVCQAAMSDPELADWIDGNVAFPSCMVDRITPRTTRADVAELQRALGVEDAWPVVCEPFTQWVIEDDFPAGRPPWEEVGVQMVDDVVPYELMKLRLLNASHQGLAHWGRLLGIKYAHEAAADADIAAWARAYLEREARATLRSVPGINLDDYISTLFKRFTNEAIADTLSRLAQDASSRMPKFVLGTVRDNLTAGGPIRLGTAMVAAWALGSEGYDENGGAIVVDDPLAEELRHLMAAQRAGHGTAFICHEGIFGGLATNERFRRTFVEELEALRRQGARARLRALAGRTRAA